MVVRDGRLCKANEQAIRLAQDTAPLGDNVNWDKGYREPPSFPFIYMGKGAPANRTQIYDPVQFFNFYNTLTSLLTGGKAAYIKKKKSQAGPFSG